MDGIYHCIRIKAPRHAVFSALTTAEGLAGWWTRDTTQRGDVIDFGFGSDGGPIMKVEELESDRRLKWRCLSGPVDWVGSHLTFELRDDESGGTSLDFQHSNWRRETELTGRCSMRWAGFLLSLKSLVENGRGRPYPDDISL
jgi:uncharacterized protein YndB with AHSA1/START domain